MSDSSSSRHSSGESSKSSISNSSVPLTKFPSGSTSAEKPNVEPLDSVRTLKLLGFTETRAASVWARYLAQPDDMEAGIYDFARWEIKTPLVPDVETSTDDWISCMDSLGIDERLKKGIMKKTMKIFDTRRRASIGF